MKLEKRMEISKEFAYAYEVYKDPSNSYLVEMKPCPDDPEDPIYENELYKSDIGNTMFGMCSNIKASTGDMILYVLSEEIKKGHIKMNIEFIDNSKENYINHLIEALYDTEEEEN